MNGKNNLQNSVARMNAALNARATPPAAPRFDNDITVMDNKINALGELINKIAETFRNDLLSLRQNSSIQAPNSELLEKFSELSTEITIKTQQMERSIRALSSSHDLMKTKIGSMDSNTDIEGINSKITDLHLQVSKVVGTNSKLSAMLNTIKDEIDGFKEEDNAQTEILTMIGNLKRENQRDINTMKDDIKASFEEISQLDEEHVKLKEISNSKFKELKELREEIRNQMEEIKSHIVPNIEESLKNGLNQLTRELKTQVSNLQKHHHELSKKVDEQENSIMEKISDVKNKTERSERNNDQNNTRTRTELENLRNEIKTVSAYLERSKKPEIDDRAELKEIQINLRNLNDSKELIARRVDVLERKEIKDERFEPKIAEIPREIVEDDETKRQIRDLEFKLRNIERQISEIGQNRNSEKLEKKLERNLKKLEEKIEENSQNREELLRTIGNIDARINRFFSQDNEETEDDHHHHNHDKIKGLEWQIAELGEKIKHSDCEKKLKKIEHEICELSKQLEEYVKKCEIEKILEEYLCIIERQVKESEQEIKDLKSQICYLSKDNELNKKKIDQLDANIKTLSATIKISFDDLYVKYNKLNDDNKDINKKLNELEYKVKFLDDKIDANDKSLRYAIDDLSRNLNALEIMTRESLDRFSEKLNAIELIVLTQGEKIGELSAKIIVLERYMDDSKLEDERLKGMIDELKLTVKDLQDENRLISDRIERDHIQTKRELEKLNSKIDEANGAICLMETLISELDKEQKRMEEEFVKFRDADAEMLLLIKANQAEIALIENETIPKIFLQIDDINAKDKILEEQINHIDKKLDKHREHDECRFEKINHELNQIECKIKHNKEEFDKFRDEMIRLQEKDAKDIIKLNAELHLLDVKLNELKDETNASIVQLRIEIEILKRQMEETNLKIIELKILIEKINADLLAEIGKLKDKISNIEIELAKIKIITEKNSSEICILKSVVKENADNIVQIKLALQQMNLEILAIRELAEKTAADLALLKVLVNDIDAKLIALKVIVDKNTQDIIAINAEILWIKNNYVTKCEFNEFKHRIEEQIRGECKPSSSSECHEEKHHHHKEKIECEEFYTFSNPNKSSKLVIYPGYDGIAQSKDKNCTTLAVSEGKKLILVGDVQIPNLCSKNLIVDEKIENSHLNARTIHKGDTSLEISANESKVVKTGYRILGLNVFYNGWLVPPSYDTYIWKQISNTEIKIETFNYIAKTKHGEISEGTYTLNWF